ncbi:MAG TPA: hypothetical protein PLV31_05200 [Gammaproteobacteria bacterium]|nr:hypothetical protein [Gammaproteobacteria bacterium]
MIKSDIAASQAASKVLRETKGQYVMESNSVTGSLKSFILFEVNPVTKNKVEVAKITPVVNDNTQEKTMIAHFTSPIKDTAINAVAGFAKECQRNDTTICPKTPSGVISTFSNSKHNSLVKKSFSKQFKQKNLKERFFQSLRDIAKKDNNTVTNTADLALKEEKPSAPQKLSMH